jgi:hypothetical protein
LLHIVFVSSHSLSLSLSLSLSISFSIFLAFAFACNSRGNCHTLTDGASFSLSLSLSLFSLFSLSSSFFLLVSSFLVTQSTYSSPCARHKLSTHEKSLHYFFYITRFISCILILTLKLPFGSVFMKKERLLSKNNTLQGLTSKQQTNNFRAIKHEL